MSEKSPPEGSPKGIGATLEEIPRWKRLDFEAIERDGIPEIDWIFPGWIVAGDIFLIAGDAGVGKSTVLSRLGYAAASGGEWVGIQATRKVSVLYIDEEESDAEVYHLFTKHGPRPTDALLRVFVQQGANLGSDAGLAIIEREVADFIPRLLLIDSATAAFGNIEGNNNAEVAAVYRRLFHLRKTYGLTIGFNHHLGKPGELKRSLMHRVLGAVAFGTQASAVFGAIPHDADSLELVQGKRRLARKPYPSMIVGYREENGRCYLENRGAVEDNATAIVGCSEFLVAHLEELGGPAKRAALIEADKRRPVPFGEDIVDRALKHCVTIGRVSKPKTAWYAIEGAASLPLLDGGGE